MADALYVFQSLVPTGIALQYTAVEEGIVACIIFWGDIVLTRQERADGLT